MTIWKKLFGSNPSEVYASALSYEHSNSALYKRLLAKAAALGHCDAQLQYGLELVRGEFDKENPIDGFEWLEKAANQGSSEAWFTIGMMFKDGHLVFQDFRQAFRMFKRATDFGHVEAELELGFLYYKGLGVEKSNDQAIDLYSRAAKAGNPNACFNLGLMYWKGEGVEADIATARHWLEQAKHLGNPRAESVLFLIVEQEKIAIEGALLWNAATNLIAPILTWPDDLEEVEDNEFFDGGAELTQEEIKHKKIDDSNFDGNSIEKSIAEVNILKSKVEYELVSTSALGRIIGIKAKPYLFAELLRLGYIEQTKGRYILTRLGKSIESSGRYRQLPNGKEVVTWPVELGASLLHLKKEFLDRIEFRLFHMTHVENLDSILQNGLFSHNAAPTYLDISNPDVNSRRERTDPVHGKSLHDYVPMYFNPRNAMLYEKQMEYRSEVVIIEINRKVCLSNYTLFTERNAAASGCRFVYCLSDLEKFNWSRILSHNWANEGIVNVDTKQMMMSECLVQGHVDTANLVAVHTMNTSMSLKLQFMLADFWRPSIHTSPSLFF